MVAKMDGAICHETPYRSLSQPHPEPPDREAQPWQQPDAELLLSLRSSEQLSILHRSVRIDRLRGAAPTLRPSAIAASSYSVRVIPRAAGSRPASRCGTR